MVLITLGFSLLRPRNSVVYAPKLKYADEKHAPPRIGKGLFAWISPVLKMKEPELVEKIGLDAVVFLRFTRMCRDMLLGTTIFSIIILIANAVGSTKGISNSVASEDRFFVIMTPALVWNQKVLWVHVVCAYFINAIVAFFLWWNYKAVGRLRRTYFTSAGYLKSLHSRTLMLVEIPQNARSDEGILRLCDSIEQTAGIPRAAIGRNVKELPDLIEEHKETVKDLESVLAKYLKNPDKLPVNRPTMTPSKKYRKNNGAHKVDAIEYLTARITNIEQEINHIRESVDKRNPMPYGFASYDTLQEAHVVAHAATKKRSKTSARIALAPPPSEIIWQNLPLSRKEKYWKRFTNNIWVLLLTIVWIAPNALIAIFLSNLSNLALVWNGFNDSLQKNRTTWAIIQGIASPAITSLVYLLIPIIFRRLSTRGGDLTKTSRERHVAQKLYAFFVFNNLIVFSAFSIIWAYVARVIDLQRTNKDVWKALKQGDFLSKLLSGLSQSGPFWLTWLLQRELGAAADLAQLLNLTWGWFARKFLSPTPRQAIEWTAPPPFEYAVYYNYFLFYATVALCFTTLQPLVIPVTALYFAIDYWLKKYLLLYVLITKNESSGQHWQFLFNRVVFAVILADFTYALVVKANGTWAMIGCMAPLILLMIAFKIYCSRTFDDELNFAVTSKNMPSDVEHLADPSQKPRKGSDRVVSRFGHPALYKPLMTPMVHARAQAVLSQVYTGRLDGTKSPPNGYGDIPLDDMSRVQRGKSTRFAETTKQKEMFEVVPESQLDFEHFKDRPEFREAFGGDGGLYGRPEDLISERSNTPRSFMHHGSRGSDEVSSLNSSRASSPMGRSPRYGSPDPVGRSPRYGSPGPPPGSRGHYRDLSGDISMGGYQQGNESESNLLRGAQPPPRGGLGMASEENLASPPMGMERWRTPLGGGAGGGAGAGGGYAGVPQGEDTGYDAYRRGR